jgi:hypothetical protein
VVLALTVERDGYVELLPGLLLFGIGLALVLTTNDPVSLDMVPEADRGQASGVSATAEQGGGAIGIAVLYALFHSAYVGRLQEIVDEGPLPDLTRETGGRLRAGLEAAEQTGLRPSHFDASLVDYLRPARAASEHGYAVAFVAVAVIAAVGFAAVALLVRRAPGGAGG